MKYENVWKKSIQISAKCRSVLNITLDFHGYR